jgi:hypothetical protein
MPLRFVVSVLHDLQGASAGLWLELEEAAEILGLYTTMPEEKALKFLAGREHPDSPEEVMCWPKPFPTSFLVISSSS